MDAVVVASSSLFGDQDEVNTEYLQQQADEFGYIFCAVDWIGLSQYDEGTVGLMLATDLTNFGATTVSISCSCFSTTIECLQPLFRIDCTKGCSMH
jgi:hypothetical protein